MRELDSNELQSISGGDGPIPMWGPEPWTPKGEGQLGGPQKEPNKNNPDEQVETKVVTNTFKLANGGETTVTGVDENNDGVVDGLEELANDQHDIEGGFIVAGSPIDNLLDWIFPGPYYSPDKSK